MGVMEIIGKIGRVKTALEKGGRGRGRQILEKNWILTQLGTMGDGDNWELRVRG